MKKTKKSAVGPVVVWQLSGGEYEIKNSGLNVKTAAFYSRAMIPNND